MKMNEGVSSPSSHWMKVYEKPKSNLLTIIV